MNRYAFLATLLTAALYTAPAAAPAVAASTIQRCEAADGTIGYTDKSCAVFDRRTVAMSSLVVEDGGQGNTTVSALSSLPAMDRRDARIGRRSLASGCARTPTQLQMDLRGAFALGDVNRIAESYHWVGMSSSQARGTMDRLQRLATHPVLDASFFNASISPAGAMFASNSAPQAGAGMMQLVLGGDGSSSVVDFDVHRYAGCYFVSF